MVGCGKNEENTPAMIEAFKKMGSKIEAPDERDDAQTPQGKLTAKLNRELTPKKEEEEA